MAAVTGAGLLTAATVLVLEVLSPAVVSYLKENLRVLYKILRPHVRESPEIRHAVVSRISRTVSESFQGFHESPQKVISKVKEQTEGNLLKQTSVPY